MSAPAPPKGLAPAGRSLWRSVVKDFDLSPAELSLLAAAARQADDLAALQRLLADQGPTVDGSKGQPRLSPIFAELRQGRLALAKLLAELRLPADEESVGLTPASRRAQTAANARWGKVRALREPGPLDEVVAHGS